MRKFLYFLARIIGDFNAVAKGKIGQRLVNKAKWRIAGRFLR